MSFNPSNYRPYYYVEPGTYDAPGEQGNAAIKGIDKQVVDEKTVEISEVQRIIVADGNMVHGAALLPLVQLTTRDYIMNFRLAQGKEKQYFLHYLLYSNGAKPALLVTVV